MNIALTGMPASGKTTTAKVLQKFFQFYTIIDTDEMIVNREKKSVNDIFSENGEEYFRQLETEVLKEILKSDNQIISTGGGIIKKVENIKLLKEKSVIIYLKADLETLVYRAEKSSERPLLNTGNVRLRLENLLTERENNYNKADFIINTENKTPEIIAKEITEKIYENYRS